MPIIKWACVHGERERERERERETEVTDGWGEGSDALSM